jgi:hypothetical protein
VNVIKLSRAISGVNAELKTNISETNSVSIFRVRVTDPENFTLTLKMETELVSETLVFNSKLILLITRENFITR